jgi:hypothetical protein
MEEEENNNKITFFSTIIDEPIFNNFGDITYPAGKKVISEISKLILKDGNLLNKPEQQSWYGWRVKLIFENVQFVFIIQLIDEWILEVLPSFSLYQYLFNRKKINNKKKAMIEEIKHLLKNNIRFYDVNLKAK